VGWLIHHRIKCCRCDVVKNRSAYNDKRLRDLTQHMRGKERFDPTLASFIPCVQCSGTSVVELECAMCGIVKAIDKFSKSQRSKGDGAECLRCVDERQGIEARRDSDESDSGGSRDGLERIEGSDDDASTVATTFSTLSVDGRRGVPLPSSHPSHATLTTARATPDRFLASTSSINSSNSSVPPHLRDKDADADDVSVTSSRASSTSTAFHLGSQTASPSPRRGYAPSATSTSNNQTSGNSKFAKVRAVPHRVVYNVAQRNGGKARGHAQGKDAEDGPDDDITVESSDEDD